MGISKQQREIVRARAQMCCEYCRISERSGAVLFHVDHIIPLKYHGGDELDNLCLACYKCNGYKGSNPGGFDPHTGNLSPLYHPRQQTWNDHFDLQDDCFMVGRTAEGRTTVVVLNINEESRVQHRQLLRELGQYPCQQDD